MLTGSMLLLFLFVSQVTADAIDPCDDGTMMPKKDDSFPKANDLCGCGPVNENYDANGNAAAQLMSTFCNAGTTCTVATKSCTCTPDADHFCYYSKVATMGYTVTFTAKFGVTHTNGGKTDGESIVALQLELRTSYKQTTALPVVPTIQ